MHQIGAIFQQEEQQIKHHAKADGEAERPFTDDKGAACHILTALKGKRGELLLNLFGVIQVIFSQIMFCPARQMLQQIGEDRRELRRVGLKFVIDRIGFDHQR